jgi:hypothetical protein
MEEYPIYSQLYSQVVTNPENELFTMGANYSEWRPMLEDALKVYFDEYAIEDLAS